jgi:hypothetical protein
VVDGANAKAREAPHFAPHLAPPKVSSGATLRTYRIAVAATGEYTAFHGGSVAGALGAIVSTINRVNGIYEREVAVRMVLVADNDRVIYTDGATDPYTNSNGSTLLGENQANLDAVIGSANYDIGHVFSTGGGGIASLGSVCDATRKARGVTGSASPVGDAFDVDYVAHEIGHQFDALHTFNSQVGSCGGNRSEWAAYETGSGVTIMAYAGICGTENLQPNSEDHFHRNSLDRILAFTTSGGGSCGSSAPTGNNPPTVAAPAAATIPRQTPFVLAASGSDPDGDTLTWLWEQYDRGPATNTAVLVDDGARPILRPLAPSRAASRVFPDWRFILANANAVPATAPLPGTTSPSFYVGETLPATARTLNFRVTARDNRAGGGGTDEASVAIAVDGSAGPFRVSAPNTAVSWPAGSTQSIAWDVAGTSAAPINTANVRITLSLDGGATFPLVLAASTPNDGAESVTVPADVAATNHARVRVEALGNVYFDVSDVDFAITSAGNAAPTIVSNGASVSIRQGTSGSATVATVADAQDAAGSLAVSAAGAPPELAVSAANTAGSVTLTASAQCTLVAPSGGSRIYPVQLTVTDSAGATAATSVNVAVARNRAPTLGTYGATIIGRGASTTVSPSAAAADPDGNALTTVVAPATLPGGGTLSVDAAGTVTVTTTAGTTLGTYVVRVSTSDPCGATASRQFTLQVASPDPVLSLAATAVTSGNAVLEPNECNTLSLTLANGGGGAATAVSATLSSSTPGVTVEQASSAYPNLAAGASAANSSAYSVSTGPALACGSSVAFTQTVTYAGAGSPAVFNFSLPIGTPPGTQYAFGSSGGGSTGSGGALVPGSQADDAAVAFVVPIGFSLYGTPIAAGSAATISTNGNIQFAAGGVAALSNVNLPASGFPAAPTVFAYWDDLDLSAAGSGVFTEVTGSAPSRVLKVQWRGVVFGTTNAVDVALRFTEGVDGFVVDYANSAAANGSGATVGVQAAPTGGLFTQFATAGGPIVPGLRLSAAIPPAVCSIGPGTCAAADTLFRNGFEP